MGRRRRSGVALLFCWGLRARSIRQCRRRTLARHLGRRRERAGARRSAQRRGAAAARPATGNGRVRARVRWRRSVLLRRRAERQGAGGAQAEAELKQPTFRFLPRRVRSTARAAPAPVNNRKTTAHSLVRRAVMVPPTTVDSTRRCPRSRNLGAHHLPRSASHRVSTGQRHPGHKKASSLPPRCCGFPKRGFTSTAPTITYFPVVETDDHRRVGDQDRVAAAFGRNFQAALDRRSRSRSR